MGRFASVPLAAAVAFCSRRRRRRACVGGKGFKFSAGMLLRFMARKAAFCIIELQRENLDDDVLVAKFNIISQFRSQAASEFNPREPRLSLLAIPPAQRVRMFSEKVVGTLVANWIIQGYKNRARLIAFLVAVRAEVSKISDLQLDTVECQAKNDFEDVCNGVIGFAGDVMSQHKHASEIECIVIAAVAESPSFMSQSVGRALKAADGWKERVAEFFANNEVMSNLVPKMEAVLQPLLNKHVTGSAIVDAAKFVVEFTEAVPSEIWLERVRKIPREANAGYYDDKMISIATSMADENLVDVASATIMHLQLVLHEVALAFPMDNFHHEMSTEVAQLIGRNQRMIFASEMLSKLSAFTESFVGPDDPQPPTTIVASNLRAALRNGKPGEHFQGPVEQARFADVISWFLQAGASFCSSGWLETIEVLDELNGFWMKPIDPQTSSCFKLACKLAGLHQAMQDHVLSAWECDNAFSTAELTKVMQLQVECKEFVQKLHNNAPTPTVNSFLVVAEGDIASASVSIQEQSVELAAAFNKHVALTVASVNLYARGDPSSSGASWLGDCPNDEWADWDDLAEQWKRTLKKMKTGTVMQGIEAMKALKDKAAELESLVGVPLDTKSINTTMGELYLTKLIVQLFRTFTKPIAPEEMRPSVRAEILEATPWLGGGEFNYKVSLPLALANKVSDIISAKRKRG